MPLPEHPNLLPFRTAKDSHRHLDTTGPPLARIGNFILGTAVAVFGLSLSGGVLWFTDGFHLMSLFLIAGTGLIGLFGVSLMVQAVRGRSRHEGVFYAVLRLLAQLPPAAVALGVPAFLALAIGIEAVSGDQRQLEGALMLSAIWAGLIGNIFLHELGHVVAARAVHLQPTRILIGPFELHRPGDRWNLTVSKDWFSLVGGSVVVNPLEEPKAWKMLVFASGGPLATLFFLGALLAENPYDALALSKMNTPGAAFFLNAMFCALVVLVVNLIPSANLLPGIPTDGYLIRKSLAQLRQGSR